MTRDTSREAYRKILDSLPRIYKTICNILWDSSEPLTSREIDKIAERGPWPVESDKRMAEMIRQDLVQECPVRECRVSGFEVLTYTVTGRPRKKVSAQQRSKRPSKTKLYQELEEACSLYEDAYQKGMTSLQHWYGGIVAALEYALGEREDLWNA